MNESKPLCEAETTNLPDNMPDRMPENPQENHPDRNPERRHKHNPMHAHNHCGMHCIKVKQISVDFDTEQILSDINLHIHCGSLTALIGPNGAGKSTLLKAILDEIPHSGGIEFTDLRTGSRPELKIGYVPQSLNIERDLPMTVYDLFASFISRRPIWIRKSKTLYKKIYEQLQIFSVEDCIDRQIGKLSGGQLQRVLLSIAITPMPNLLILDEPVSGIDRNGVKEFYRTVSELKNKYDLAILLVSHDLDLVKQYADQVVLLNHKVLCQGSPAEVYSNPAFHEIFE